MRELGFKVVSTSEDFFKCNYGEIVVSNPPYTTKNSDAANRGNNIKTRVIQRLCELNKLYMLLMPITFMKTLQIKNLQKRYGRFKFIIPCNRINFYRIKNGEREDRKNDPNVYNLSCWYCWKIKLKHSIIFV